MKLLKQCLINYLNYTNIHEYSSDTKTKSVWEKTQKLRNPTKSWY